MGLDGLAINLGDRSLFTAAADGILDRIRPHIRTDFGFGGLTLPERGSPIPCELLMSEMVRLQCGFAFLGRSFWRDALEVGVPEAIGRIRKGLAKTAELDARQLDAIARASAAWSASNCRWAAARNRLTRSPDESVGPAAFCMRRCWPRCRHRRMTRGRIPRGLSRCRRGCRPAKRCIGTCFPERRPWRSWCSRSHDESSATAS